MRSRLSTWGASFALCAAAAALGGCGGGGSKGTELGGGGALQVTRLEYGRLVDVYAFRRVTPNAPRRDVLNREPVLVERDVVIDANIESQSLFDAVGEENPAADYRYLPFDVQVGHEELLILWDDRAPDEGERFQAALTRATSNLLDIPASYRTQNTSVRPIPVVPRNAAIKLTFSGQLGARDSAFFAANPAAIQLLEIVGEPGTIGAPNAFRLLPSRLIAKNNTVIIDPTLIGGETGGANQAAGGMPVSLDSISANIRIAIPTSGIASKQFTVQDDRIPELNDVDSRGDRAVIRDFRSGNPSDGRVGSLADLERPMVVSRIAVGILEVDVPNRILTLNKRGAQVAVRGRIPYVDGALRNDTGLAGGPNLAPTVVPLRSGDLLTQTVQTALGTVQLRAEVLRNLEVGSVAGGTPTEGLTAAGNEGADLPIVRVQVASVTAIGPDGQPVTFQGSSLPLGADATLTAHYYHHVPLVESVRQRATIEAISDSDQARRAEFVAYDPAPPRLDENRQPVPPNTRIDPQATVGLTFSEPMDLATVLTADNYFLAAGHLPERETQGGRIVIGTLVNDAKAMSLAVQLTRLLDRDGNGTSLRLVPPLGHPHVKGTAESFWLHALVGPAGIKDLGGNTVDLFDLNTDVQGRVQSFSVRYDLDATKDSNTVASRVFRFAEPDEDGTKPGSIDYFGQFQLRGGVLSAAEPVRFSRQANEQTLGGILRGDKGECFDNKDYFTGTPNPPPDPTFRHVGPVFPLYFTPKMTSIVQQPPQVFTPPQAPYVFGGILEPHNPRGSRLQATYREDDFNLGYHDASTMMIDVEQLHWSPFLDRDVIYDVFDRYTMLLGHADVRPDLRPLVTWSGTTPICGLSCESLFSGLSTTFDQNPLAGTAMTSVISDKVYAINPNDAFRDPTGTKFVPYPRFERTFTWRDSRLVKWIPGENRATGLGGAKQPAASPTIPPADATADVSSPWIQDQPFLNQQGQPVPSPSGLRVTDDADFHGDRARDHDPIALPLLVEWKLWRDDTVNGAAIGSNHFQIGYVGPNNPAIQGPGPIAGWGYYNCTTIPGPNPPIWMVGYDDLLRSTNGPNCFAGKEFPSFRVHSSGGVDPANAEFFINPIQENIARGGWILDAGLGDGTLGRFQVEAADDHVYWAQADFVRRVSMVTFGFFDTLKPNQHDLNAAIGLPGKPGFPDLSAVSASLRVRDLVTVMDPPSTLQPKGTNVTVEFRGVDGIGAAAPTLYDQATDDKFNTRGNLLNANYACEAYRYAMANPGPGWTAPRVQANGITPYADLDHLDALRDPLHRLLPRYVNFRIIFENDIVSAKPRAPLLRTFGIAYRVVQPGN